MKRAIIFLVFACLAHLSASAIGAPEIRLLQDKDSSIIIEFKLNSYKIESVYLDGRVCSRIILPGQVTHLERGYPELPMINKSIIIPDNGQMDYQILEIESETKRVETVIPSRGNLYRNVDPETISYTFDKFYESDSYWPSAIIEISQPFILRDCRGVSIRFNPFQYNPVKKELRVIKRIVVEIFENGKGGENILIKKHSKIAQEFIPIYKNIFLNFDNGRYNAISEQPGRMLIITADAYNVNLQPFVYWKKKKGIYTKVVNISSIGNNPNSIKNRIQAEYDSTNLVWVLLVGDGNEVAPGIGTVGEASGADADPVYAYTAGNDYYPDLFISRFSSRNGISVNIDKQVSRSINYERIPQPGANWYHIGLGVASNQNGGTPYEDSTRCNWLRDSLLAYTYTAINKSYDPWGHRDTIKKYIELGTSIINYIGHGSIWGWSNGGGFDVNDINNLNNPWKLPFVISVACVVGNFDGNDCYCEVSVTAGTVEEPDGFLVHWGSSINQSWVPPCIGQEGAVNLLTHNQKNTFGGICFNGACYMIEYYGPTNPAGIEMAQTWHIFGDASVQLRTDTPDSMVVIHNQTVPAMPSDFVVSVKNRDGVTPLKDALVCLWIPDQNPELHIADYTDSTGCVVFNIAPTDSGDTMWITVTKYNYIPYESYAIVTNTGIEENLKSPALISGRNPNLEVYPNPFRNVTGIKFQIPNQKVVNSQYSVVSNNGVASSQKSVVSIKIYDATGRLVKSFSLTTDYCVLATIVWDGTDDLGRRLPSGVYFVRLATDGFKRIEKAILLR